MERGRIKKMGYTYELRFGVNVTILCIYDKDGDIIDNYETSGNILESVQTATESDDETNDNIEKLDIVSLRMKEVVGKSLASVEISVLPIDKNQR